MLPIGVAFTSKLCIAVEILLIQNLKNWIQKAAKRRIVRLLDDFGAGPFGIVL